MRFVKMFVAAVLFAAAGFAALPSSNMAVAHPAVRHGGFSMHDCAETCASNNNSTAQLPPAVISHEEEQEDEEAEPTPAPDTLFYVRFFRLTEPQKISPSNLYDTGMAKPPDIIKLTMNYRD